MSLRFHYKFLLLQSGNLSEKINNGTWPVRYWFCACLHAHAYRTMKIMELLSLEAGVGDISLQTFVKKTKFVNMASLFITIRSYKNWGHVPSYCLLQSIILFFFLTSVKFELYRPSWGFFFFFFFSNFQTWYMYHKVKGKEWLNVTNSDLLLI